MEATFGPGETLSLEDDWRGMFRLALVRNSRLEAVLFVAHEPFSPALDWLKSQFEQPVVLLPNRRALLAGSPDSGGRDQGAIVCVCFQVGVQRIREATAAGAATPQEIGKLLSAGTNCGSCLPEIRGLLSVGERASSLLPGSA